MIPQETSDVIENTRDKVLMWQPNIKVDERTLRNLYDASVEEKTVSILYETEDEIYREIEPMGLYVYNGYWYCPSYCRMRRDIRLFRVDRIKKTIINSNYHSRNIHLNVKEWLYSEYESNPIKLEVNLNKEGKRKAESMSWLRDNMEYNSDGTAKITKNITPSEEWFYVDLLWSIGHEAEIIEPYSIKNKLIERAKSIITKYNNL
ncbi:helix-turn-helix transcriptional regulator [Bacillus pseudomycoides]|nr:WYL domain-containing protein [Bacillus pseudomycoides]